MSIKFEILPSKQDLRFDVQNTPSAISGFDVKNAPAITTNHNALTNRDLPDQHPIESITGLLGELERVALQTASENVLGGIKVGDNLQIDESGVLSVDTETLIDYIDAVILGGAS